MPKPPSAGCATGVPNLATLPARHTKTALKHDRTDTSFFNKRVHIQKSHCHGSDMDIKSASAPAERRLRNWSAEVAEATETAEKAHESR